MVRVEGVEVELGQGIQTDLRCPTAFPQKQGDIAEMGCSTTEGMSGMPPQRNGLAVVDKPRIQETLPFSTFSTASATWHVVGSWLEIAA